jgi:hypothetical protein
LVLLGTAAEYPFAGIPAAVEVMNGTEQGTWPNEASMISWADQIFIAAHPVFYLDHFTMLFHKMKAARGHIPVNVIYGIFNLPMPCGVGACDACMVRCKTSDRYACLQGPALDLAEVQLI